MLPTPTTDGGPTSPWRRRALSCVVTALLALTGAQLAPAPASATLAGVGPVSPAGSASEGFPAWYADANGLALEPCLDGPPNCLVAAQDFVPVHQDGGDAEAFYFQADAQVGPITVSNALEAAYAGQGPGQELVFVRTQVAARTGGLQAGGSYTVTDPYGTLSTCTASATGVIATNACRTETVPAALDFTGALAGRVGPFLTWDTLGNPALGAPPPAGYIGDATTPHKVVGSPTGFNKVRVTGPGINADLLASCAADWTGAPEDCAETDLFVVQGKIHPGPSASLSASTLAFGNVSAAVTKQLTYTSTGSQPVTVGSVARTGSAAFSVGADTCSGATVAPGSHCTVDVTYTPTAGASASGAVVLTDSTIASPRSVSLSGSSLPVLGVDRTGISFASQPAGSTSPPEVVVVSNSGAAPLDVGSAVIGGAGSGHFSVVGNSCTAPVPPGGGCEIAVAFAPFTNGVKSATLALVTDGGNRSLPLSGTATVPVVSPPTTPPATPPAADHQSPFVTGRIPGATASRVPRGSGIAATFSEDVAGWGPGTVTVQRLSRRRGVVGTVTGTFAYDAATRTGTVDPFGRTARRLAPSTRYRVTLSAGLRDAAGNALAPTSWVFRTGRR